MFVESMTPAPSSAPVRFRADRVAAVKGAPYQTASPWSELIFIGGGESVVVAEDPDTVAERIAEVVNALRTET